MRILAVSDEVIPWMYSPAIKDRVGDVDLVISCGDLPIYYLEFIASSLDRPCVYVRGNHDQYEIGPNGVIKTHPGGWIPLDMTREEVGGLQIGGLDGCLRYNADAPYQYTQQEQWLRAWVLASRCLGPLMARKRALDILVTHAPPYAIHNGNDHAHTGFHAINWIMRAMKPRFVLHGHQHRNYAMLQSGETEVDGTTVLNVHPYRIFNY